MCKMQTPERALALDLTLQQTCPPSQASHPEAPVAVVMVVVMITGSYRVALFTGGEKADARILVSSKRALFSGSGPPT